MLKTKWYRHFKKLKLLFISPTNESGLNEILEQLSSIGNISDRTEFFEKLTQWLARDSATPGLYVRFRFFFQQLEKNPNFKELFKIQVRLLFKESSLLKFFLTTGFADQHGLLQEVSRRVLSRLIPSVRANDFYELFNDTFESEDQLSWFEQIPPELIQQLGALFTATEILEIRHQIYSAASEAIVVMTSNLAFLGLTSEIRARSKQSNPSDSPFLQLQLELQKMLEKDSLGHAINNQLTVLRSSSRKIIEDVYADMEKNGTSIGLVYRLEVMTAILDRLTILLGLFNPATAEGSEKHIHLVFTVCARATFSSESVLEHFRQQTHLLSRKIAERNGESGDHYIARDKKERRKLFYSALKGGVIVVLMTLTKLILHSWHLPALLEAFCIWMIYAVGFLSMQFTDSTLATKLPSFTASKLARLMTTVRGSSGLEQINLELKTVLKSQGVAFFGNILAVIPLALMMEVIINSVFNTHLIDHHLAEETLHGLNPVTSLAIVFGIITGVLLWISSIAGGWFENWIVFRKIPKAIKHHKRMNRVFGKLKSEQVSIWLEKNASGISANVVLGFLFALLPFMGTVTGVPLDSKHVTISSASAALSALTIPRDEHLYSLLAWASVGLIFIGLANLLVSFTLALFVAAKASLIDRRRFRTLIGIILRRLIGR